MQPTHIGCVKNEGRFNSLQTNKQILFRQTVPSTAIDYMWVVLVQSRSTGSIRKHLFVTAALALFDVAYTTSVITGRNK